MSLHREDIKHGIDKAAENLKHAIDSIADSTSESRDRFRHKAKEVTRKAGDEMIEQGHRLKRAAEDSEDEAPAERQFPC